MAKGNNRKQKETKKPKKEKVKVSATANSLAGKPAIGTKKVKRHTVRLFRATSFTPIWSLHFFLL